MSKPRKTDLERVATVLTALSNPSRLKLFLRLASEVIEDSACAGGDEPCACVGELAEESSLSPSTVSHHLKVLYNAGLIRMDRCGQRVHCCIDTDALRDVMVFLNESVGGRSTE